jgi:protein TonB
LKTPPPDYPPKALDAGVEGWVEVEFTVMPDGSVQDVSVVGADPPKTFEVAAVKAVSQWTFAPASRNGAPIAAHVRQKIDFKP